jgi:Arc/MetJ family transcription regulator
MRTNIEIDDKLIEEARRITGLSTKKAIVERALQELVRRERQREVLDYFGKLTSWEGDLDAMREGRRFE